MLPSSRLPLLLYPSLSVMLNTPGGASELSAATMVNVTGRPLSVPEPVSVTVWVTWLNVAAGTCVDWNFTPEAASLNEALPVGWVESS